MKHIISILCTSVVVWGMVVLLLCLTACDSDFYQSNGGGGFSKPGSIPEPIVKVPPYHWEDFSYDWSSNNLKPRKIVSNDGGQFRPDICDNKIAYVDQGLNGFQSIIIKDLTTLAGKWVVRSTNAPVLNLRLTNDVVAWMEGANPSSVSIYYLLLSQNQNEAPQLIAENVNVTDSVRNFYVSGDLICWSQKTAPSGAYQLHYYDMLYQKSHEVASVAAVNFKVMKPWVVFMPSNTKNIYAYNVYSAEQFKINSDTSDPIGVMTTMSDTYHDRVIWVDNRYTQLSLFEYDINVGHQGFEQPLLYMGQNGNYTFRLERMGSLLYIQTGASLFNILDLDHFRRYSYTIPESASPLDSFGFWGNKFVVSYNDSLYKGNYDIFLGEVPQ